ncbi:DUF4153 domain-containing protein [Herminiimonas sp. KBW02]|uniref:DUF4153 domain-containing protein n=1 Tax=Herminiimonas sp. KBW02 TaxID=2153363 RepID=UPI000F5A23A7|nr:DUF4153 domain-containing protein [Herminiimonas sp. KBW02]RQO37203.1 DUF4153 domain-containing protein [Herminiimonas sp. KBW02]
MHTADEELSIPKAIVTGRVARLRLLTGLLQGVILYALYYSLKEKFWPSTSGYLFSPLTMIFVFVPILFISALGHLNTRRMWIWMAIATLICVLLSVYDIWRMAALDGNNLLTDGSLRPTPSAMLVVFITGGFYIAHALVLAAANDERRIARYPTYFETAWKLIIQIKFSVLFVAVLWLILWLGATLFMLVKLSFLQTLLEQSWFFIPVTTFAFSTALHITDVRPGIVRGIRGLLLVLMSWLLPITTLIVAGFLLTLPFTGLELLWATRHATSVLLGTSATLVLLINAAFQGGEVGKEVARVLRFSARLACVLLLPMALIAIYSLTLRVQQYGWSVDRVIAASCLLVATCYACGYLWAALERGVWLTRIAAINVLTAFLTLAILLALFTPVADPVRISVANQMARLESGQVGADKFDFTYLRFEGARYGDRALRALKEKTEGPDAALISKRAAVALERKSRWSEPDVKMDATLRAANITVWPSGQSLPEAFLKQDMRNVERNYMLPDCLKLEHSKCDAYLLDIDGDGKTEILMRNERNYGQAVLFAQQTDGTWKPAGTMTGGFKCKGVNEDLAAGRAHGVAPLFPDLEVAGERFHIQPWASDDSKCKTPVAKN